MCCLDDCVVQGEVVEENEEQAAGHALAMMVGEGQPALSVVNRRVSRGAHRRIDMADA